MEKYEQISVIGEGSYGLVLKCRHRETDEIVAIKKFLETEEDATIRKMALREIRMLKRLKHENLVTMIEVFRHRKRFYLVFEYLEGTVLDELDKMPGGLGDERSKERIFQVVRAISFCHGNNIIHRDVKPENVLVSSLGVVKLCDFGFARMISSSSGNNGEPCTEYVATRWYRAPELLVSEPCYGSPVDVWAVGCLFAEMMTGEPLFPGDSDIDQLYLIVKMLGKPCQRHLNLVSKNSQLRTALKMPNDDYIGLYKHFSTWTLQAIEFLSGCMKMDPHHRLSADDLLKHNYFTHDRFPQRFLPALREKVNIEFSSPLLRKFKTEIIMSTDKKDESRCRRSSQTESKWRINLQEGSMKRKYSYETVYGEVQNDKNYATLSKAAQKLTTLQKNVQTMTNKSVNKEKFCKNVNQPKVHQNNNDTEVQMLEKSLESLAKFNNKSTNERPNSDEASNLIVSDSPPPFQSLHFGFGDYNKSPSQNILHPSINNISFNKDPPKRSPNIIHNINNATNKTSQVPLLVNPRTPFMKKFERTAATDNIFGNIDQGQAWNNGPLWLNSFTTNAYKKRDSKQKSEEFTLPNLPGATLSPNKTGRKILPELELPHSTEITPEYRYRRAKRKRNTIDISLPVTIRENRVF